MRSRMTRPWHRMRAERAVDDGNFAAGGGKIVVPIASAVGNAEPVVPPDASCTRYAWPGATMPDSAVGDQEVLAADAFCTVQPVRSTDEVPRLKSST